MITWIRAIVFRRPLPRRVGDWELGTDERWRFAPAREVLDATEVCRECGCTDLAACPGGCYWVAAGLCSRCVPSYGGTD